MMTEKPFNKNDRVKIKPYIDPMVYNGLSVMHNEGWIRDTTEDSIGFPMVLIEWDKNHWSYNGAPNGWTFADHFEKVETGMSSRATEIQELMGAFTQRLIEIVDSQETSEPIQDELGAISAVEEAVHGPQINEAEARRDNALEQIFDRLSESEAFIIIGVDRDDDDTLSPYSMRFAMTPDAAIVSEAHISTVASDSHQNFAMGALRAYYSATQNGNE